MDEPQAVKQLVHLLGFFVVVRVSFETPRLQFPALFIPSHFPNSSLVHVAQPDSVSKNLRQEGFHLFDSQHNL
jgi:hypothetical protein